VQYTLCAGKYSIIGGLQCLPNLLKMAYKNVG